MASFPPHDLMPDEMPQHEKVFVAVTTLFTFLSTVAVGLRFASRVLTLSVKWDDWTCLGALILAYGCFFTVLTAATVAHGGYDIWLYSQSTIEKYMQSVLAYNMMYVASVVLAKASILLFYQRIFQIRKPFRVASWIMGFVVIGYFISNELGLIFSFSPVEAQWKIWLPFTTIHILKFWLATGSINIVLDVMILCMPQPLVWKLKMTLKQRILLSGVFFLGGLVCIASILRLYFLTKVDLMNGPEATQVTAGIWQAVEMNMGIICSCLATYPSLYRHIRRKASSRAQTYGSSDHTDSNPLKGSAYGGTTMLSQGSQIERASADKTNQEPGWAMNDLGPVHIQTDVNVRWDEESRKSSSNMV